MFAPANLLRPITDKVNRETVRSAQAVAFRQCMNEMSCDTVSSTPEEWSRFIEVEPGKRAKIAKIAGLKSQ